MRWVNINSRNAVFLAEHLSGSPETNPWTKWVYGVVIPAVAIAWSLVYTLMYGFATEAGIAAILALFAHVHYFWCQCERLEPFAELGKSILVLPLLGLIGYRCYVFIVTFI